MLINIVSYPKQLECFVCHQKSTRKINRSDSGPLLSLRNGKMEKVGHVVASSINKSD